MEIHREFIANLLQEHGLHDCKPVSTLLNPRSHLSTSISPQSAAEAAEMCQLPYISIVGSLMYLAVTTRPDIAYSAGVLARFNSNPGLQHWQAVKHVLRYLKGTMDYKLVYQPSDSPEPFITYSDSDHGGNPDNGKSTGGFVVKIGTGAVSWSSKLQALIALSTTKAEHIAAVEAGKEILWMRQFMGELGYLISRPSLLRMDNQSTISVSKNPEHHSKMKHLSLHLFWLRDVVQDGFITSTFVSTSDMAADIFTKTLVLTWGSVIWATVVSAQCFCGCLPSLFIICLVRFAFTAVDGVLGPSVSFSPLQSPWPSVTQGPFTVSVKTPWSLLCCADPGIFCASCCAFWSIALKCPIQTPQKYHLCHWRSCHYHLSPRHGHGAYG
jgi:hypothetical protein